MLRAAASPGHGKRRRSKDEFSCSTRAGKRSRGSYHLLHLPAAIVEHVLSFLQPAHLAAAQSACSMFNEATKAAMLLQSQQLGMPHDWYERYHDTMPRGTPPLHLLHVLRESGPVAQLVVQLRCPTGTTAALANARLKMIPPALLSSGADMLSPLLSHPSRIARCGALNALAKANTEVIARLAHLIELRLQDGAEFVRLAALNALCRLPTHKLASHKFALELCRDDIRNDSEINGGFVFRQVRMALNRINATGSFDGAFGDPITATQFHVPGASTTITGDSDDEV